MPGLIDGHGHSMLVAPSMFQLMEGDLGCLTLLASVEAEATLMRGFTTVRDLGGPLTQRELLHANQLADSPDEVRLRKREQLPLGALQIKLIAGGGVASPHSPLADIDLIGDPAKNLLR